MKNNILALVITLTVGIILAGSLLMPVISEAQRGYETETFTNPSSYGAEYVTAATITLESGTLKYNDAAYTVGNSKIPMIVADNLNFQINASSTGSNNIIYCDADGPVRSDNIKALDLTLADGSIELTYTDANDVEETTTIPCSWAYVITTTTGVRDYTIYNLYGSSKNVYYNSIKDYHANGYTMSGDTIESVVSVSEGAAILNDEAATLQVSGFTEVSGYNEVYSGTISYNTGISVTDGETTVYPWFVVLPTTVTGYVEPDKAMDILSVIPVLIIASLVVVASSVIILRRD